MRRGRRRERGGEAVDEASIRERTMSASAPSTPSTVLAAICVVDSSLALAVEWSKIYSDYLAPIIQRLAELASNVSQVTVPIGSQPSC